MLERRTDWTVAATFERSFYIRNGDAFICIGDTSIGDGPLNVLVAHLPAISIGTPCCVDTAAAAVWHVSLSPFSGGEGQGEGRPLVPTPATATSPAFEEVRASGCPSPSDRPVGRSSALSPEGAGEREGLLASVRSVAPLESFIHALDEVEPASGLHRHARIGITALQRGDFDAAVTSLAGLGHGLTPSGDDVLAGALLMLHALGRAEQAATLADAIRRIAPARTSPLSFALLEPALDGEPNAAVHRAITALLTRAPPAAVIELLHDLGATSGFDILAGILIAAGTE